MMDAPITINQQCVDAVIQQTKTVSEETIPQPIAIVGPEGSGKSTILLRLQSQLESSILIDGREIFSTEDIICQTNGASFILLDNADFYFQRTDYQEQYKLRAHLNQQGAPMLICTIKKIYRAFTDYDAAFFDGFQFEFIPKVEISTISNIDSKRFNHLMNILPQYIRYINIAYDIVAQNTDIDRDITQLLNLLADKFTLIYNGLPANAQRIVTSLAKSPTGMKLGEIRHNSGLSSSTISTYMVSLVENGLVTKDTPAKMKTVYAIKDKCFALWLRI